MRRWPIAVRLVAAALVIVAILLPVAGVALSYAFTASVNTAFDQRLQAIANVLAGSVRLTPEGHLSLSQGLGDPRFEQVFSGWYWQISDAQGVQLVSRSLWDESLTPLEAEPGHSTAATRTGPRGQGVRVVQQTIQLSGYPRPVQLMVGGPTEAVDVEVARFQRLLTLALATLAALLLGLLAVQIRWGLAPLRHMGADLKRVEAGEGHALDDRLPPELRDLARAMNAVLDRDRQLIERGRTAAGNLAHALKTPLTVMKTQVDQVGEPHQRILREQIERIDTAVRHHLARASAAGSATLAGAVDVDEALRPVLDAVQRMAERQRVTLESQVTPGLTVQMDPQDLQEVVGNLLENGVRWAHTRVHLTIQRTGDSLSLQVEDDGPGMSAAQRQQALGRGNRLDGVKSQSGLGLDIVRDLVELYRGNLQLDTSPLGGLRASITLR